VLVVVFVLVGHGFLLYWRVRDGEVTALSLRLIEVIVNLKRYRFGMTNVKK
jgi:hypothetical protein